jgi:sulfide dehydrogenase [flavocytochrome c] flavoprotein chain
MTPAAPSRRQVIAAAAAGAANAALARPLRAQGAQPRIVVVGGGFGGATVARFLKRADPKLDVTLVEANPIFSSCPFSNEVIAGLRDMASQYFRYDRIAADGIAIVHQPAIAVDAAARSVTMGDRTRLGYDRLVIAPGIDLRFDALPGYDEAAVERMPHAWKAGEQTVLLRKQLEAMEDGGTVVMSLPALPYRCPPAPYERASLIAYYLKTKKPRSKIIVLDAKDTFSKQRLFENAWKELYPNLEWISLSSGGNPTGVDAKTKTIMSDFDTYKADVANVIPPQRAAQITSTAGVADRTGWCPVDPITFESQLVPNIHVIGDAAIAGAMPKAASAASAEGRICAAAVSELLQGRTPQPRELGSSCYSLIAPDFALAIGDKYRPTDGQFMEVEGNATSTPADATAEQHAQEAKSADAWFAATTRETFG